MDEPTYEELLERAEALLSEAPDRPAAAELAHQAVNRALCLRVHDHRGWTLKSYIMSTLSDDASALAAAEMAARLCPDEPECHHARALSLWELGQAELALHAVRRALSCLAMGEEVTPEVEELAEDLYFLWAQVLTAAGDEEQALAALEQGHRRYPGSLLLAQSRAPLYEARRRRTFRVVDGGRSRG